MTNSYIAPDGKPRCKWCSFAPEFLEYHDNEWGYPVKDDFKLFEKICLEGFQSGLSWRTILVKRENFRKAFLNFDFYKIANFGEEEINILVSDAGIVRHKGKIEAVINNAKMAINMVKSEGSLAKYFWQFEDDNNENPQSKSTSDISIKISKDLKKRGWKFVGPTTIFAFMQAMGLINDHANDCIIRDNVEQARKDFVKP